MIVTLLVNPIKAFLSHSIRIMVARPMRVLFTVRVIARPSLVRLQLLRWRVLLLH
jgi:hypothetical protein